MTVSLQRVHPEWPHHEECLRTVWSWMEAESVYLEATGFESWEEFSRPYLPHVAAFFALSDGRLLGFFEAIFHDGDEVEIHLTLPARPRLRPIFAALEQLEDDLFQIVGAARLFAYLPEGARREPVAKLSAHLGFRRSSDEMVEISRNEWEKLKSADSGNVAA